MITHTKAKSLLRQHGIATGWTPTAWYPSTGLLDETSTFYWEFGIHEWYNKYQVLGWLGY